MILESGNMFLGIELDQNPSIMLKAKEPASLEMQYILNKEDIKALQEYFSTRMGGWVEIVTKEDLKTMLECVKAGCIQANKTANAAVEVANRLSEIYERYNNVDRTQSD